MLTVPLTIHLSLDVATLLQARALAEGVDEATLALWLIVEACKQTPDEAAAAPSEELSRF